MFVVSAIIDLCVISTFSIISVILTALNISACTGEEWLVSTFPISLILSSLVLSISSVNTTVHVIEDYNYPKLAALGFGFGCILCHLAFIVISAIAFSLSETCLRVGTVLFDVSVISYAFLIWSCVKLMTSISAKLRF